MTKIIGDRELRAKLAKLSDLRFLKTYIRGAAEHVAGKISDYPPEGSGNSSSFPTWYKRGYGTMRRRADGSITGRNTTEDLGLSWLGGVDVVSNTRAVIGNDASYGKWVQGGDTQTAIMHDIGWKTTDTVVKEESAEVLKQIQKAVDKELRK